MEQKKRSKKAPKSKPQPRRKFKFIKGCKELVKDPFNLN